MNTPSHRSKAIKNYVLASVILSILIVLGFTFRSAVMDTVMTVTSIIAKDGTSSETSSKSRARLRVPSSTQHFLDAFPKLLSTLPKSVANLESLVNEVSLKRRSADPHLDKGIRNHWGAALYNQDEKESLFDRQWQNCHASLIENYKNRSLDPESLKQRIEKFLGLFLESGDANNSFDEAERMEMTAEAKDPFSDYLLSRDEANDNKITKTKMFSLINSSMQEAKDPILALYIIQEKFDRSLLNEYELDSVFKTGIKAMEVMSRDPRYNDHLCLYAGLLYTFITNSDGAVWEQVIASATGPAMPGESNPPEWYVHTCIGFVAFQVASLYRGTSFISKVGSEDLNDFERYSENAASHLMYAWTLEPTVSTLPTVLMSMQMRAGCTYYSKDEWFRHALSIRPFFPSCWDAYATSCQPRWGGSEKELMRFAEKLSEFVGRDDGAYCFCMNPIQVLLNEYGNDRLLIEPELKTITDRCLDRIRRETDPRLLPNDISHSLLTKSLWDQNRFADTLWMLNRREIPGYQFERIGMPFSLAKNLCSAVNDQTHQNWIAIKNNLLERCHELTLAEIDSTIELLNQVQNQTPDEFQLAVDKCQHLASSVKSFHQGNEVQLQFSDQYPVWLTAAKEGSIVNEETFEFETDINDTGRILSSIARFPLPYQIEATVEQLTPTDDFMAVALATCLTKDSVRGERGISFRYSPYRRATLLDNLGSDDYGVTNKYMLVPGTASGRVPTGKLSIEMTESGVACSFDDVTVFEQKRAFRNRGEVIVTREIEGNPKKQTASQIKYRISKLVVRKLY